MNDVRTVSWDSSLSRAELAPDAAESLPSPEGAPMVLNAYSMIAFAPIFDAVFALLAPRMVCEIGVDLATMSPFLLNRVRRHSSGGSLHCVDAAFKSETLAAIAALSGGRNDVVPHSQMSREFLQGDIARQCDYFVVDGDHNYETVSEELALVEDARKELPTVVFLHDVGWPCGRRDMYYDPSRIADLKDAVSGRLSPFSALVGETGLEYRIPVAIESGGERNGVQTAIDDFVQSRQGDWSYFSVPMFFGLGVLWRPAAVGAQIDQGIRNLAAMIDLLRPLLGYAELNRLILLMRVQEGGKAWTSQQKEITRLRDALRQIRGTRA